MKITVSRDQLALALRKVQSAVNNRHVMPVFTNILVSAKDDKLVLTGSDLDLTIQCQISAVIERPGIVTLPAKVFSQLVGTLSGGEVTLSSEDNLQTTISSDSSNTKLMGMDWSSFRPDMEFDETWSFSIGSSVFKKALSKVSYSRSSEESRKVLNGILISIRSGVLTFAATDGRRLALLENKLENGDTLPDGDMILPPKVVAELERIIDRDENMAVRISENLVSFQTSDMLVVSKIVEGTYPNFRTVIPSSFSKQAVMKREEFGTKLARATIVLQNTSNAVSLAIKPAELQISAVCPESGTSTDSVAVSYDGAPITISFNPDFLIAPLRHLECDYITLRFNDDFSPVAISGDEGFLYIIMPMRH